MDASAHRLVRLLPPALRRALRAWNSVRQVRAFTDDRWAESAAVRSLIRPGDVVVDAGANIGYITALLARWVGPGGCVHSVEPIPETFRLLERSVRRLGLAQVRCHACALSDQAGRAWMEVPSYPDGVENFYESRVTDHAPAAGRAVAVPLRTLDEVVGDTLDRVTFVKIDVEGHEAAALRGATQLLSRARPALLIEINSPLDEPDAPTASLLGQLRELGYRAFLATPEGWVERQPGQRAVDYYFLTADHLARTKSEQRERGAS